MNRIKTHIKLPSSVQKEITYSWCIFCHYLGYEAVFTERINEAEISIGIPESSCVITISEKFIRNYENKQYRFDRYFSDEALIYDEKGLPDYLSTAFYMINCLQEYASEVEDKYGRFDYEKSYQKKYDCYGDNLVGKYFDILAGELGLKRRKSWPKKVFLSHDLDFIKRGNLTEAKHELMSGKLPAALQKIYRHLSGRSEWLNIEELIELHKSHGLSSAFFWLPKKGRSNGIKNADYSVKNKNIQMTFDRVEQEPGFFNGLHKSTFNTSFSEELKLLPGPVGINRNHFLHFSLPEHYERLCKSNIEADSSLGFSQNIGFRNSFGLPFYPFDIENKKVHPVMEIPVNMMDTRYLYHPDKIKDAANEVIRFLENNQHFLPSLLWHNNYLTSGVFSPFRDEYIKLLEYLKDNNYSSFTEDDIKGEYRMSFPDSLKQQTTDNHIFS